MDVRYNDDKENDSSCDSTQQLIISKDSTSNKFHSKEKNRQGCELHRCSALAHAIDVIHTRCKYTRMERAMR